MSLLGIVAEWDLASIGYLAWPWKEMAFPFCRFLRWYPLPAGILRLKG